MRAELISLLVARGFDRADATAFVGRLTDQQVTEDLRWHRWEAQWFAHGAPSTWPVAIQQQVTAHYLGPAHNLAGWDLMAMDARLAPATSTPPTRPSGTGVVIVGVALVLAAAGVAYALARE